MTAVQKLNIRRCSNTNSLREFNLRGTGITDVGGTHASVEKNVFLYSRLKSIGLLSLNSGGSDS